MMHRPPPRNRYGVEIKVPTVHMECESLADVLAMLEGQAGVARVFDRHSQTMVVDGAVNDVRDSLGDLTTVGNRENCCGVQDGIPGVEAARPTALDMGRDAPEPRGHKLQVFGAMNISSAYYFGDLGGVARRRDGNGQEIFFRPMITRMRTAG